MPDSHALKMAAVDAELAANAQKRKENLKRIEAADRKYRTYTRSHA